MIKIKPILYFALFFIVLLESGFPLSAQVKPGGKIMNILFIA